MENILRRGEHIEYKISPFISVLIESEIWRKKEEMIGADVECNFRGKRVESAVNWKRSNWSSQGERAPDISTVWSRNNCAVKKLNETRMLTLNSLPCRKISASVFSPGIVPFFRVFPRLTAAVLAIFPTAFQLLPRRWIVGDLHSNEFLKRSSRVTGGPICHSTLTRFLRLPRRMNFHVKRSEIWHRSSTWLLSGLFFFLCSWILFWDTT